MKVWLRVQWLMWNWEWQEIQFLFVCCCFLWNKTLSWVGWLWLWPITIQPSWATKWTIIHGIYLWANTSPFLKFFICHSSLIEVKLLILYLNFLFCFAFFQIFRTERIKNSQNPTFTKGFILEYCFEELQKLKFSVYDIDNKTPDLKDDDFLGSMECTLGQVS